MYSTLSGCLLASSTLMQMWPVSRLQEPHLVFIRRRVHRRAFTPILGSHLARTPGTASREPLPIPPIKKRRRRGAFKAVAISDDARKLQAPLLELWKTKHWMAEEITRAASEAYKPS